MPLTVPSEWSTHSAMWIGFPSHAELWQEDLDAAQQEVAALARALAGPGEERVRLMVCGEAGHAAAQALVGDVAGVEIVRGRFGDVWLRDTGPIFAQQDDAIVGQAFRFNGWGGKYECADDAQIASRLHATGILGEGSRDPVDFVLEGGSIEIDGQGSIMTTSRCLLNPNRNPTFSKTAIEEVLHRQLGAKQVLWLDHGYAEGDDTDAHVDTLARFCSENVVAYTASDRPEDPVHEDLTRMESQLKGFRNLKGEAYEWVPLPIPAPIYSEEGDRLPATYANFLIINDAVLVPVYNDPNDAVALSRLAAVFPDRTLVPIDCVPLIRQYGSLHCMTMQFPHLT